MRPDAIWTYGRWKLGCSRGENCIILYECCKDALGNEYWELLDRFIADPIDRDRALVYSLLEKLL
jgi:hypothetical protein